jgi:hypothetical protein
VAYRHDHTRAIAVAEIELAGIRPSAAVPPFGMCPEPSPIQPNNIISDEQSCNSYQTSGAFSKYCVKYLANIASGPALLADGKAQRYAEPPLCHRGVGRVLDLRLSALCREDPITSRDM